MVDFHPAFLAAVQEQARRNNDAIEQACERMLTTPGSPGVLVQPLETGAVEVSLDPQVPFGEVHWLPYSMARP